MYSNKYVTELLKDAIYMVSLSEKAYSALYENSKDIDDKKMYQKIKLNKYKHINMLKDIYLKITDTEYSIDHIEDVKGYTVPELMYNEIAYIDILKPLMFAFENSQFKNYIAETIVDSQNHTAILNYIYCRNKE